MPKHILLIDGSGIFHGAKALGKNMDYAKIMAVVKNTAGIQPGDPMEAVYYTPFDTDNVSQRGFIGWLTNNGYKVVTTPVTHRRENKIHTVSSDTALATDIYRYHSKGYAVYLVSGNSAYMYPIKKVLEDGGEVHVFGFVGSTSQLIRRTVGTYTKLDELDVFFDRPGTDNPPAVKPMPSTKPRGAKDDWRHLEEEDVIIVNA